jgi:DNA-binding SARP family transcriptional activator
VKATIRNSPVPTGNVRIAKRLRDKAGRLRVRLLGPPGVERDGRPVAPDTRKAIALLAYLAVTGQAQGRDRLAALLWPEADQERARGALRRTLSALRGVLGGEHLSTDGLKVSLDVAGLECDVTRFRALLADGRLVDASRAYTGDLLSGFSLKDCVEFDEWQAREADALRRELAGALERLAQEEPDPARAVAYAQRWLALDPLHEPAHRALVRLHGRAGDRAAAIRQYRECVRLLDRELGVTPLPETTALARAIEAGEPEPLTSRTPAPNVNERVGDLYTLHGDYAKAIASYAAALAESPVPYRSLVEHKLADVYHRQGDWEEAEKHYRAALRGVDDAARRARVTADWALAAHRRGVRIRATGLAEEALTLARRANDDRALAQAHNILGILGGDRRHLEESLAIADRVGEPAAQVAAMNNLALALARDGEVERAIALTRDALAASAAIGDLHREAALHNNLADLLHRAGQKGEAMRALKRAVRLFAEIGEDATREPEVWKLVEW